MWMRRGPACSRRPPMKRATVAWSLRAQCPNRLTTRSRLPRTAHEPCSRPPKRSSKSLRTKARTQRLCADADGTVVETLAEPGQFVSAGQIVVRMARAGAREAAVNLPETLRPALGSTAYAILYGATADSATRYPARLRQLSDAADPLTRTFEARYVLDGVAATAPLGATVTVYLKELGAGRCPVSSARGDR